MNNYTMFQLETVQLTYNRKEHNTIPEITTAKER